MSSFNISSFLNRPLNQNTEISTPQSESTSVSLSNIRSQFQVTQLSANPTQTTAASLADNLLQPSTSASKIYELGLPTHS